MNPPSFAARSTRFRSQWTSFPAETLREFARSARTIGESVVFGLDNVSLRFAAPGDANIDGLFNSTDLVQVFQRGE
jgi:hypothetical protein